LVGAMDVALKVKTKRKEIISLIFLFIEIIVPCYCIKIKA
jgi:hypothetical protein